MRAHWAYFKYVMRHKYFVFRACALTGASFWLGLIHDLSKFRPSEWVPYAHTFYAADGTNQYKPTVEFDIAWVKHQHRNPHHHQHWTLLNDDGTIELLPMPEKYVREMIADWIGAGMAIHGRNEVHGWFHANKSKMRLHKDTETLIYKVLQEVLEQVGFRG